MEADSDDCDDNESKEMIEAWKLERKKKVEKQILEGTRVRTCRCESCLVTIASEGTCEKCGENERERKRDLHCTLCSVSIAGGGTCEKCRNKICEGWLGGIS